MTQQIIDVGTAPNDGLGDPIRTAFQKTNNNFTQLFSVGSPNTIVNGTSNVSINTANGNVTIGVANVSNVVVVTSNSVNVTGNLNVTGNITYTDISTLHVTDPLIELAANNTSNLFDIGLYAPINPGVQQNTGMVRDHTDGAWKFFSNVVATPTTTINWANAVYDPVKTGPLSAVGNITGNTFFTGNIIPAANVTYSLGNSTNQWNDLWVSNSTIYINSVPVTMAGTTLQVDGYNVVTAGSNVINTGNIETTGNVSGNYIIGDGSQLTNLPPGNYSNSNVAAYLPTYTGNLVALTGNVTTTANISGNYFIGDGSLLTNLPLGGYGNSNVANYLPTYTGNLVALTGDITTTANISGNYILGNGAFLTGISVGSTYGNSNVADYLPTYSGNIANLTVTGNLVATTQGNSDNSNLVATTSFVQSVVTAAGGYGNAQVAIYLPTYAGNLVSLTGPVTTTANVSGANVLTGGIVSATGNITGDQFIGNGATLSSITGANVTGTVGNATFATSAGSATSATTAGTVTGNAQANITSVGTLTSLDVSGTANITGMFKLPSYTTAQIANLSATGGELVYNTSVNAIQGYQYNPILSAMGWANISVGYTAYYS